jgi:hypothetical protein
MRKEEPHIMEKIIYDDDIRDVTRLHNRALRTVNRSLRREAEKAKQRTDEIVAALFDAPALESPAEAALRRIWERTGGILQCSPDDYDAIADAVIARF